MSSPLPQSRLRVQRIAEAAVERARLTVVPRQRVRAPRVPFVVLVSLVLLGGVVGLLMFNTSMQQNAFAASALETRAGDLRSQEQSLTSELEELRDPQHIGEKARKLGMVLPVEPAFLQLDGQGGGRILGAPGNSAGQAPPAGVGAFDPREPAAEKPDSLIPQTIRIAGRPERKQTDDTRRRSPSRSR